MFEREREESDAFFSYFSEKYGEEVGLMLSFYDDEEFEMDLIVGMDSEIIYGLNIIQYIPKEVEDEEDSDEEDGDVEDYDDDEEEDDEEDDDEDYDDDEEENDEEDDDEDYDEIQYIFVKKEISPSELNGSPYFQITLSENQDDEEENQEEKDELEEKPGIVSKREEVNLIVYAIPLDPEETQDVSELEAQMVKLTGAIKFTGKISAPENVVVYAADPDLF